jgi:hypothetical protein
MPDKGANTKPAVHVQKQKVPLPGRKKIRLMQPDEKAVACESEARGDRRAKRGVPLLYATEGLERGALEPDVREQLGEKPRGHGAGADAPVGYGEHEASLVVPVPVLNWADNMRHQVRDGMDMHLGNGTDVGPRQAGASQREQGGGVRHVTPLHRDSLSVSGQAAKDAAMSGGASEVRRPPDRAGAEPRPGSKPGGDILVSVGANGDSIGGARRQAAVPLVQHTH